MLADLTIKSAPGQVINFRYRNWQGELSEGIALVRGLVYGSTEWHPEQQWLLEAVDLKKDAVRLFALCDIVPI